MNVHAHLLLMLVLCLLCLVFIPNTQCLALPIVQTVDGSADGSADGSGDVSINLTNIPNANSTATTTTEPTKSQLLTIIIVFSCMSLVDLIYLVYKDCKKKFNQTPTWANIVSYLKSLFEQLNDTHSRYYADKNVVPHKWVLSDILDYIMYLVALPAELSIICSFAVLYCVLSNIYMCISTIFMCVVGVPSCAGVSNFNSPNDAVSTNA